MCAQMCAVESFEFNYVATLQILRLSKKIDCSGIVEFILVTSVPRLTCFQGFQLVVRNIF